jgi:hypothetical protein
MVTFTDYPDFKPDYSPKQMFQMGIFSGMYFRPIHSAITGKNYKDQYKEFEFLKELPVKLLDNGKWDASLNKFKVKAGSPLEYWENAGWIKPQDPYGHLQWYCRFYNGRRTVDDRRQIDRANNMLMRFGQRKDKSARVKQALLHWGWDANADHSKYIAKIKKN